LRVDERGSFGYYAIGEGVVAVEVIEYICPGPPCSETSAIRDFRNQKRSRSYSCADLSVPPALGDPFSGILNYGLLSECKRGVMRFALAIFCLFACGTSALAQSGVSSQRDRYGNVNRDTGTYPARGVSRGPINNGPINNGPINDAPARPSTSNSRTNGSTSR
jgi:hypothetical protein